MSQQGLRQASVRAVTGTAGTYEGDWHALFDQESIPAGPFNGRLLGWINIKLNAAYGHLGEAQQALALASGAFNFATMGTFDASTSPPTEVPENSGLPTVTGIETVGETLTATNASWSNGPILSRARQWYSANDGSGTGAAEIPGADDQTYVIGALSGKWIRVGEIATNVVGDSDEAFSAWVGPIEAADGPTVIDIGQSGATLLSLDFSDKPAGNRVTFNIPDGYGADVRIAV